MDQFIGIYENTVSKDYCERAIAYFDKLQELGYTKDRQSSENISKLKKQDDSMFSNTVENIYLEHSGQLMYEFNECFWEKYKQYVDRFNVLLDMEAHKNYTIKLQKTPPGGGYHMWHAETMNRQTSHRVLVWTLYLNDVEEGGETEFLYQRQRIKPKAGTLAIWPTGFTHTHRGNPPLSEDKYIITGWTEF